MLTDETQANGRVGVVGDDVLSELLGRLVDLASRPLEEAEALPPEMYTNRALYELEIERIWRRSWLYAGRVEELARPGDWIALEVAGEPVVVTRARDGRLHALSRVCRHRFMDVLGERQESRGHSDRFVCPYHSWTYDLDGTLGGAPLMSESKLFQRERESICLRRYGIATWQGFVFVNLDPDAAPLEATFDEIEGAFGRYDASEWRLVDRVDWGENEGNWKLVMDNGREPYHHQGTHRHTLQPLWPAHMVAMEPSDGDFWVGRMFVSPRAAVGVEDDHYINPTVLPPAPRLTPYDRSHHLVVGVYPGFVVAPGPDSMFTLSWLPTGPATHTFESCVLLHESRLDEPNVEQAIGELRDFLSRIMAEDLEALRVVQRTVSTTRAVERGGPLSHLERTVWQFQRYLARRLTGAVLGDGR